MGELRKDYILDRWVLVSTNRASRPDQHKVVSGTVAHDHEAISHCFFCPGNEESTPPEIGRIEKDGKWNLRWIPNKFAALSPDGQHDIRTDNTYYTFSTAYGYHEIIIETPDHHRQLEEFSAEELEPVLQVYQRRIEEMMLKPHIAFVDIFKNSGQKGGTSLLHTHSQLMALNHIPKLIRDELSAFKKYPHCPFCDVIMRESGSHRRCFENDGFVAFTPYASRFNYEIWIFPKAHIKNLSGITDLSDLASILHQVLDRVRAVADGYNFFLHYSPVDDFHFHIEVCPRISTWAGFELSSDEVINVVSPEEAASYYRGES